MSYRVLDPTSNIQRETPSAHTAAAYVVAWAILYAADAEMEGVPVVVDGRTYRVTSAMVNLLDRPAVAKVLRQLRAASGHPTRSACRIV